MTPYSKLLPAAFCLLLLTGCRQPPVNEVFDSPPPSVARALPTPPAKFLLQTTFVPQAPEQNWDQPWQDACEEAALLTVHYYYQQLSPDLATITADLRSLIDSPENPTHDQNLNKMALLARTTWGYQTQIVDNPDLETIKSALLDGTPVIIPANGKTLYRENKHFRQGGPYYHNLVILGFDDTQGQFIVHDVGTRFGPYFRYSYQLLLSAIHDWPETDRKEDIDSGPPRALIITM